MKVNRLILYHESDFGNKRSQYKDVYILVENGDLSVSKSEYSIPLFNVSMYDVASINIGGDNEMVINGCLQDGSNAEVHIML